MKLSGNKRLWSLERTISIIAALLTIGQVAYWAYGTIKDMAIPLWAYLTSVITSFVAAALVFRNPQRNAVNAQLLGFKVLDRISFDYLPDSPQNHGWRLSVDEPEGAHPAFSAAQDSPLLGAMKVLQHSRFALDYTANQTQSLANMVELYIKLDDACFYLKTRVVSRDGTGSKDVWLAHILGQGQPVQAYVNEWTVCVQGEVLENGWLQWKLPIEDEVSRTFGKEGWIYSRLLGFRIRGSLCISPITLYHFGKTQ